MRPRITLIRAGFRYTQGVYQNAENFLRDFVFEQYLPENYKKPVPPKSKNAFQNFTQSTISYDDLMQKKLKARMMEEGRG